VSDAISAAPAAPTATPSFERQLDSKLSSDGGSSLSGDVASRASAAYGTDMGAVRVHTDSQSAAMAESKGFQAFSYGGDVFGTSSALDTSTVHGQHVMMHELAHVAQTGGQRAGGVHGKVEVGTATDASDALEVDADKGAAAAVAGGSYSVQRAPLAVRGFGATAGRDAHGVRNQRDIVHENQTLHGAQAAGFSAAEGDMMYSGNWNRDMNQLLIPKLRQGHPVLFTAMDLLHTLHFGFPIGGQAGAAPGTSPGRAAVREFGTYDPVEHIDNPGGLTGADVNAPGGHADASVNAGAGNQAYAEVDRRYQQQLQSVQARAAAGDASARIINPEEPNAAFRVDESGIPIYLQTSRTQLIGHLQDGLDQAARGTTDAEKQASYDRALRYAGESLHIMQDYYAHSNFCEIAMNLLIDSHFTADGNVAEEGQGGRSFVEALNLAEFNRDLTQANAHHLNSYVHRRGADGRVDGANMTTGPNGRGREVMATGTFTLEDTIHSLKEKMGIALDRLNPFEHGASEKGRRLMTWLQSNPTYFPFQPTEAAQWIGERMSSVVPAINAMGRGTNVLLEGHGRASAAIEEGWGRARGAWHSMLGDREQAQADVAAGDQRAEATRNESAARQAAVTRFAAEWDRTATAMQTGNLVSLYEFATGPGAGPRLSQLARMIPIVGDNAAELVERTVQSIKEWLRQRLEAAWHTAMHQLTAEINAALALALGSSEVHDETGARGMTQPTHTDIAKDFDAGQNGSEDRFSVVEEVGEFLQRVGGARRASATVIARARARFDAVMSRRTGVVEGLRGAGQDLAAELQAGEREEGGHAHQHRHAGAWLAPLADGLARGASAAILQAYRPLLERARTGARVDVGPAAAVVGQWYAHPADCRGLWEGSFTSLLAGSGRDSATGREIRAVLARRMAQPPTAQTPNDQSTIGGVNRHGGHDHGDNDHGTGEAGQRFNRDHEFPGEREGAEDEHEHHDHH